MPTRANHRIVRHPALPWVELRISHETRDCYRAHSHAEYSVGLVDAGEARFCHPDGVDGVRAGSVVMIEPEIVHACNPAGDRPWSYRMLFIDAGWLRGAIARLDGGAAAPVEFMARHAADAALRGELDRLFRQLATDVAAAPWSAALLACLQARLRCASGTGATVPLELAPALAAMRAAPVGNVAVKALASTCGLSETQFIRRFKHAFGLTPGAYLQNSRVNHARRLLARGAALAEAALDTGFADQAHLQRAFKAHHAMTPGGYRRAPG